MTLNGAIMQLVEMRENSLMPAFFKPYFDKVIETVSECEEPSAQPKTQLSTEDTTFDCISRQSAIDALYHWEMCYTWDEHCREYRDLPYIVSPSKVIDGLPSAQPETANIIVGKSRDGMTMWYQCDNCNEPVDENDLYCRGCGRRFEHGSD